MIKPTTSLLYWALAVGFVLVYAVRILSAGFSFPVPWPDESAFLWQSVAIQRHWTLFAPELNPLRHIMWMPPGYMIIIGVLFKIFGSSFTVARAASNVCMCGSFLLLASVLRKESRTIVPIVLLGLMFLSLPFIAIGNVARMDSMVLLFATAAMALFAFRRDFAALAILALAPLLHPNGALVALAGLLFVTVDGRWKSVRFTPTHVAFAAIVAAAWISYAVYVVGHWNDFLGDMAPLFHRKLDRPMLLFKWYNLAILALLFFVAAYGIRKRIASPLLLVFGAMMWIQYLFGMEMWYQCFLGTAIILLLVGVMPIISTLSATLLPAFKVTRARALINGGLVLACLFVALRGFSNWKFALTPWIKSWSGMQASSIGTPYYTTDDIKKIRAYLASLEQSPEPVMISWFPQADAICFADMETERVRFCQGTFYQFSPTISMVHVTRLATDWWNDDYTTLLQELGAMPGASVPNVYFRDSTEGMYAGPIAPKHEQPVPLEFHN